VTYHATRNRLCLPSEVSAVLLAHWPFGRSHQ
jgi:hypothetical protein